MGQRSWYTVPRAFMLEENHVMCPWAWRNWLSVGSTSSRFAAPPILPPPLWYNETIDGDATWEAFPLMRRNARSGGMRCPGIFVITTRAFCSPRFYLIRLVVWEAVVRPGRRHFPFISGIRKNANFLQRVSAASFRPPSRKRNVLLKKTHKTKHTPV